MFTIIVPNGKDVLMRLCIHLPMRKRNMPPPALPIPTSNMARNMFMTVEFMFATYNALSGNVVRVA